MTFADTVLATALGVTLFVLMIAATGLLIEVFVPWLEERISALLTKILGKKNT